MTLATESQEGMKRLLPLALYGLLSVLNPSAARSNTTDGPLASAPVEPAPERALNHLQAAAELEDCLQRHGSDHKAIQRLIRELRNGLIQLSNDLRSSFEVSIVGYDEKLILRSFNQPGITSGTALSGYWHPPLGADMTQGTSLSQLGALLKTTLRF